MNKFENRFFTVLSEQDEALADRQAMEDTLDDTTDPSDFDTDTTSSAADNATMQASQALAKQEQEMVVKLENWVKKMKEFNTFLNDPNDPNSLQYALKNAEAETLFGKMKREQTKITRVAAEVASLMEELNGYIGQSQNASLKYV